MNDRINSFEKQNELMDNKKFKFKNLSKKIILRKYFTSKSVDISKMLKIINEEIENENIRKSKSFEKKKYFRYRKK